MLLHFNIVRTPSRYMVPKISFYAYFGMTMQVSNSTAKD